MPDLNSNNPINKNRIKSSGANAAVLKAMIVMLLVLTGVTATLGYFVYSEYAKDEPAKATADSPFGNNQNDSDSQNAMLASIETDKIYDNILINGVNVGSMSKSQALTTLNKELTAPLEENIITLTYEGRSFEFPYKAFMVGYELEEALKTAFAYARDGSVLDRFDKVNDLKSEPFEITAPFFYDENAVKDAVMSLEEEINIPAVDASIQRVEGKFVTSKEAAGVKLDVNATAALVSDLLRNREGGVVGIVVSEDKPRFYEKDLQNAQSLIGTFTTKTTSGNTPRNTNLRNALSKINNVVIYPGEVFSTNEYFGEMSYNNGYTIASIIVGGKFEDGMGGGVCQVSSTLYMALLHAELEIVERLNHSLKVTYADYGFDATLSGDYIDLKFRNDTDYPVIIEGFMEGGSVTVNLYGYEIHSQNRTLKFTNKLISTTAPAQGKVVEDSTLALGQQVEVTPARNGYKYELIKTVYENNVEIDKVVINTSNYKATPGETRVGTNPNIPTENNAGESASGGENANQTSQEQQQPPVEENTDHSVWPDGIPGGNTQSDVPSDLSDFADPADLDLSIINAIQNADNLP